MTETTIPVELDRTTKNYAVYEAEDPLGGQQAITGMYVSREQLEEEHGEVPELLEVSLGEFDLEE